MATIKKNAKKTTKKTTKKALTWGKGVVHPVRKTACGGRPMSQRDMKLFTKMGKRRAGVTPTMVKEAYGQKKAAKKPAKKKTVAKRKPAAKKKTTAKKKTPAAKKHIGRKGSSTKRRLGSTVTISGCPARCQRYVIVDGRMRFQSSSRLLTGARKKVEALVKKHPRKVFRIVDTK